MKTSRFVDALIRRDSRWPGGEGGGVPVSRKKGILDETPLWNANYFISHLARIVLLRYSLSDDRSSLLLSSLTRETDDVNTPLENVPRQTSIIARPPWSLWIITDHRCRRNWAAERDRVALFYRVMSAREIYDYRFSACDATPDIFVQPRALIRLLIKAFNIRIMCIRNNYCRLFFAILILSDKYFLLRSYLFFSTRTYISSLSWLKRF